MGPKSSENKQNLVAISDLPIYRETRPVTDYVFVEEEPIPLERGVRSVRRSLMDKYGSVVDTFKPIDTALKSTKSFVVRTDQYIREEWTVLPKAAAITVGGMAGFVLGLRRYGIRKFVYATGGLLTMAAFCYPHEAIDVTRVGYAHAQRTWEDFQRAPDPKEK